MAAESPCSRSSVELDGLVRSGQLRPKQVQLAASLGSAPARAQGLPKLALRRHFIQWLADIHNGLPADVKRVLRSATRFPHLALPPELSVGWGADCVERVLSIFESAVPGDPRPRQAVETARAWVRGKADVETCRAAAVAANEAVATAARVGRGPFVGPRVLCGIRFDCGAAAVAYAARDLIDRVPPFGIVCVPAWTGPDQAAIGAGHAANWAAHAVRHTRPELAWQRQRLIDLLLTPNPGIWDAE